MGTRSFAFEVLAVTQLTSHCVRICLLAEDAERCELISGQEISLGHDDTDRGPSRWIVREFNPRTKHLTVGSILALGSLEARRWLSSVVPGEMVWVQPSRCLTGKERYRSRSAQAQSHRVRSRRPHPQPDPLPCIQQRED
jgi:hypothetical protein